MKKHITAIIITASILLSVALLITASVLSNKIAIAKKETQDIQENTLINTMIAEEKLIYLNKIISEAEADIASFNDDALAYLELLNEYDKLAIESSQLKNKMYLLQNQLSDISGISPIFDAEDLAFSAANNCFTLTENDTLGELLIVFGKLNTYSVMGDKGETELWNGTWYISDGILTLKHQVGGTAEFRPVMTFSITTNTLFYTEEQHNYVAEHIINTYKQYGIKDGAMFIPYNLDNKEDK